MSQKISERTTVDALAAGDLFPIADVSGATNADKNRNALSSQIATYVQGAVKASAANAKDTTNTSTLLTPANLLDVMALRVLFVLTGANMNSTADQQFTKVGTFTNWIMAVGPRCCNPSTNLTTAAGGIYTAASKGGSALVASSQVYTNASSATTGQAMTATASALGVWSVTPYLSLTTGQGSTATADFYIFGFPLS